MAAEEPAELAALERRYQGAIKDATARRADGALQDFENALAGSKAVIARSESEVLRLATSTRELYATYYHLKEAGLRLPGGDEWDVLRQLADIVLFGDNKKDIRFGAISLDGLGLANYGPCSIVLREEMIAHRTSVFEENSAVFMERHKIKISRKPKLPKGHRATWGARARLCVAKLHGEIDSTTGPDKYSGILLRAGATSEDDDFVEVHIFGPMTVLTMERVIVMAPHASKRVKAIRSKLAKHRVQVN